MLGPDQALWPSPNPRFLIWGQVVETDEVFKFFKRKGIESPLEKAYATSLSGCEPKVKLLDVETHGAAFLTTDTEQASLASLAQLVVAENTHVAAHIVTLDGLAVANLQKYCFDYIGLARWGLIHSEPEVHQFSDHGQFGERMRDGLAHISENRPEGHAIFNSGLELVPRLLHDCHPMALAQIISVFCIFAAHHAHYKLAHLL